MEKHMQHPDHATQSLCGMVIQTSVPIGSTRSDCEICKALYNNGVKTVRREGNPVQEREMRMREHIDKRNARVKYNSLDEHEHNFVQMCGIYGLMEGWVYNTENDTFPTMADIEKEMIIGGTLK